MIPVPRNIKRRFHKDEHTNILSLDAESQEKAPMKTALTKGETQLMQKDYRGRACKPRVERLGAPQPASGRRFLTVGYDTVAAAVSTTTSGAVARVNKELPRYVFWAIVALLAAVFAMNLGAQAAFAQAAGQDTGDAIGQTLANVRNYLAGLAFGVGGIGFVASLLVKGYASINENAHAYAAMGMKGSLWCIVAGVIVTPILSIAAGLAGGGGGGGG